MDHDAKKHFTIHINKKPYDWDHPSITGAQVKTLAGVPQDYQVVLILPGQQLDPPVGDQEAIDLTEHHQAQFRVFRQSTTEG